VSHTRELYEHVQQNLLPPLREALRLEMARYAAGAIDLARVVWVRQRLLAAEEQWVQARAASARAHVRWLSSRGKLTSQALP
jgi:outer membrane protein TolC